MSTDVYTLRLSAILSLTRRLHRGCESGEIACCILLLGNRSTVAQSFADVKRPHRSCRDACRAAPTTEIVCFYYFLEHDRPAPRCYHWICMAYVRKSRRFRIYAVFPSSACPRWPPDSATPAPRTTTPPPKSEPGRTTGTPSQRSGRCARRAQSHPWIPCASSVHCRAARAC